MRNMPARHVDIHGIRAVKRASSSERMCVHAGVRACVRVDAL
jgi:hypothetical protein